MYLKTKNNFLIFLTKQSFFKLSDFVLRFLHQRPYRLRPYPHSLTVPTVHERKNFPIFSNGNRTVMVTCQKHKNYCIYIFKELLIINAKLNLL